MRNGTGGGTNGGTSGGVAGAALLCAAALVPAHMARAQTVPDLAQAATLVVAQTNRLRAAQGLPPATPSAALTATAQGFAQFMAETDRYGHEADGRQPAQRAQAQGYAFCMVSENIAYQFNSAGFATAGLAAAVAGGWEQSPPHRHNMLAPQATDTGVALARSARSGRIYAVQMFGRPAAMALHFRISNDAPRAAAYDIDGQRFDLPPGVTRSHAQCSAERLALGDSVLRPADGGRYRIAAAPGGLRLLTD